MIDAARGALRSRIAPIGLVLVAALGGAAGCGGAPIPPTYTEAELQQQCARTGGWWRPDDLRGGYCERRGI